MQQCIREAMVTQPSLRTFDGTAETTIATDRTTDRTRGQIETEIGLLDLATHHLAWRRTAVRRCAAAGLPDAEIFLCSLI